jgi:hypothetical protein
MNEPVKEFAHKGLEVLLVHMDPGDELGNRPAMVIRNPFYKRSWVIMIEAAYTYWDEDDPDLAFKKCFHAGQVLMRTPSEVQDAVWHYIPELLDMAPPDNPWNIDPKTLEGLSFRVNGEEIIG